ncbi:MAG: S-layer homology domain-containing protein [Oscillospiraceae bacterium]|nr:S-layer homology domain-containing protein [Oscillospiraceae bacterium]
MKKRITKLTAIYLAILMCLSMLPTALAYDLPNEEDYTSSITIAVSENAVSSAGFYTATLSMDEYLANAVAAHYSRGTTAEEFKSLRFRCVLQDDLIEKCIAEGITFDEGDVNFNDNASINGKVFVPASDDYVTYADNYIAIDYKLNPDVVDSWTTVGDVKAALMNPMQMKSNAIAGLTAAMIEEAKGADGEITTTAAVVMTAEAGSGMNYGSFTDFLSAERLVGYGEETWGKKDSSGGDGGLSSDVTSTKKYDIKVENLSDKGSVTTNKTEASKGTVVTITSVAEEGYSIKSLTVKTADGRDIAVIKKSNTTYTFTMPAADVTVTSDFKAAIADPADTGVGDILNTDDHIAYMFGYPEGDFRPQGNITRAEVCQMFYNLMRNKEVTETAPFSDVDQNQWYAKAVNKLSEMKIINGVGNNKFEPNRAITRAEFATIVARFVTPTRNAFDFVDVTTDHWAYSYVSTAAGYGWINGVGDNKFEPSRNILRAEAATLVNHMLGRIADKEAIDAGRAKVWPDVGNTYWGRYEVAETTTEHSYSFNDERTKETWVD